MRIINKYDRIEKQEESNDKDLTNGYCKIILNKDSKFNNNLFNELYGLKEEKELVIKVLKWFYEKEKYDNLNISIPKGILLYGQPGNGKSFMIKQIIKNAFCPVILYVNSNFNYIDELFEITKKYKKCIVLIDELDLAIKKNYSAIRSLQDALDGLDSNSNVLVLGATNDLDEIEEPLLRKGRFDYSIEIKSPTKEESILYMKDMFKRYNVNIDQNVDFNRIEIMLTNFSFSDIKAIVNNTILENFGKTITYSMISKEIYKINNGVSTNFNIINNFRISLHEAGHVFLAYYF